MLSQREHAVAELRADVAIEPASLSQQLAVLRHAGVVRSRKQGSAVYYSITSPEIAQLLVVARSILTGMYSDQAELLEELRSAP
ncbi:transcriptional regulator, ArsR family [Pseudonocardia sp. Ae263_Ps1]|nr:transcriptional regulator, ArsR family [Pseudonocardia sp. Ae263_Ps1]